VCRGPEASPGASSASQAGLTGSRQVARSRHAALEAKTQAHNEEALAAARDAWEAERERSGTLSARPLTYSAGSRAGWFASADA
jgi:hypothetical protein